MAKRTKSQHPLTSSVASQGAAAAAKPRNDVVAAKQALRDKAKARARLTTTRFQATTRRVDPPAPAKDTTEKEVRIAKRRPSDVPEPRPKKRLAEKEAEMRRDSHQDIAKAIVRSQLSPRITTYRATTNKLNAKVPVRAVARMLPVAPVRDPNPMLLTEYELDIFLHMKDIEVMPLLRKNSLVVHAMVRLAQWQTRRT